MYRFGGFQRPINADGSSVFKLGSTVPAKIVLTDVNGRPVAGTVATLQISKLADNVEGSSLEATSTAAATSGSQFRYDPEAGQYMFNLATKTLSTGTWLLRASLDDGTTHTTQISLRRAQPWSPRASDSTGACSSGCCARPNKCRPG